MRMFNGIVNGGTELVNVLAGSDIPILTRGRNMTIMAAKVNPDGLVADPNSTNGSKPGPDFGVVQASFKTGQTELSRTWVSDKATVIYLKGDAAKGTGVAVTPNIGFDENDVVYSGQVPEGTLSLTFPGLASGETVAWQVMYQ